MTIAAPDYSGLTQTFSAFHATGADIPTLPAPAAPPAVPAQARRPAPPPRPALSGLGQIGNLFGGGSPLGAIGTTPLFDTPAHASLHDFRVPSDLYRGPYVVPGELDPYTRADRAKQFAFVQLFKAIPELKSALLSKANSIAAAQFTVQPESWSRPEDRAAAKLCTYALENCRNGSDGLVKAIVLGAFIQGASAVEVRFRPDTVPGFGPATGVKLAYRGLDISRLGLELDPYRDTMGVVSFVRGLETFAAKQVIWHTHEELFADPFGNSDVYPLIDACNAIVETNRLWDLAIEMYSSGYAVGTTPDPGKLQQMADTLQNLRTYGYAALSEKEKIELLNLGASSSWQAFKDRLEAIRERVYLAVRYVFLPFVQGSGGGQDKRGDTGIHQDTADVSVDLPARAVGRLIREYIFERIVEWNCPPVNGQPVGVPKLKVGGIDPEEVGKFVAMIKQASEAGVPISRAFVSEESGIPPPEDDDDVFQPPQQPGEAGPAGPPPAAGAAPTGQPPAPAGDQGPPQPQPAAGPTPTRPPPPNMAEAVRGLLAELAGGAA